MHPPIRRALAPFAACLLASAAAVAAEPPEALADPATWLARRWATTDLAALASAARAWRAQSGSWPSDCAAAAARHLSPAPKSDPWGSPYGCRRDGERLVVFSPGADGKAGTPDDVTMDAESDAARAESRADAGAPAPAAPVVAAAPEALATAERLRRLGTALESFRKKEGHYPVTDKVEHLERWLVAEHLAPADWSADDGWGRTLRYRTTDVGSSYTLSSSGADGRWELLEPDAQGAGGPEADLAMADGRLVRWPAGAGPSAAPPAPKGAVAAASEEPADPAERTRTRLRDLASRIARQARDGRYAESDDAERLAREMGAPRLATDGWGRAVHYLSADGGKRFALVSAGPDGRLARDMEAYARGAAPAGDDVLAGAQGLVN